MERPKEIITGAAAEVGQEKFAVEVKNEAVWVNKGVEMPFRIEEGKPTKLGVFLIENQQRQRKGMTVKAFDEHFRSVLLGRVVFRDKDGRLYRDVDMKGTGGLRNFGFNLFVAPLNPGSVETLGKKEMSWGILDWGHQEKDRELSEFFTKKGLRTHRVLAIIRLDEILDERGRKISVLDARERGYIKKDEEPVIAVRAFGTKARIIEARNPKLFEDAKAMVAQELGKNPDQFSDNEYFDWFAETLGKQVGLLHRLGYYHRYLTCHNISLDCRIVDLDSVRKHSRNNNIRKRGVQDDMNMAFDSFMFLLRVAKKDADVHYMEKLFFKGYRSEMSEKFLRGKPEIKAEFFESE